MNLKSGAFINMQLQIPANLTTVANMMSPFQVSASMPALSFPTLNEGRLNKHRVKFVSTFFQFEDEIIYRVNKS